MVFNNWTSILKSPFALSKRSASKGLIELENMKTKKPILLIIGTRAEAIKLIPLYLELKYKNFPVLLCATFQHSEMLQQVCNVFEVVPDFNLNVMKKDQDLFYLTKIILEQTKEVYLKVSPSLVVVHGDTTTTMASALSAFYLNIPIAHVEAGLRTGNMRAPFPEEMNRKVVGQIASLHFSPTSLSTANLLSEGIKRENVFCTGNTIVDSLKFISQKIDSNKTKIDKKLQNLIVKIKSKNKRIVLLTAHRRESFNGGLLRIFSSIKKFAQTHSDVNIIFPVHPNPNVKKSIEESKLEEQKNIILLGPTNYIEMVYLLNNVEWIVTDSGGLQEEGVSLGKKVIVLRDVTERMEGIWEGLVFISGTDEKLILENMQKLYDSQNNNQLPSTVYGDGHACKRISKILETRLDRDSLEEDLITHINHQIKYENPIRKNI